MNENEMNENEMNENEMNENEMNYVSSLVGLCIALCLFFYSSTIALELSECRQIVCYTLEVQF